jgi:hypothetical protein
LTPLAVVAWGLLCLGATVCRADDKPADAAAASSSPSPSPSSTSQVDDPNGSDGRHWAILVYRGLMTNNSLWQVIGARNVVFKYGDVSAVDILHELAHENPFRKFFQPLVGTIYLGGNVSMHQDSLGGGLELAPYLMWRWRHLPFERLVVSTIGVGEGVSYVTSVPLRERALGAGGKQLLDFMAVETTIGPPSHREIEFVLRIQHRSPAFGLFGTSVSSNALGLGARYFF